LSQIALDLLPFSVENEKNKLRLKKKNVQNKEENYARWKELSILQVSEKN